MNIVFDPGPNGAVSEGLTRAISSSRAIIGPAIIIDHGEGLPNLMTRCT
jgi:hypothetical protein